MKTLVAISTCRKFEEDGANDALRETWLTDCAANGLDYRMFVGKGAGEVKPDTVALDCGDDYNAITWKSLGKFRWAVDNGYDFAFHCFTDTYARPERLTNCGFELHDCYGTFFSIGPSPLMLNSGPGYFLSRRTMQIILAGPKPVGKTAETYEDAFVTSRLRHCRELIIGDSPPQFVQFGAGPRSWNSVVTRHLFFRLCNELRYSPQMMRDEHRDWLNSQEKA